MDKFNQKPLSFEDMGTRRVSLHLSGNQETNWWSGISCLSVSNCVSCVISLWEIYFVVGIINYCPLPSLKVGKPSVHKNPSLRIVHSSATSSTCLKLV